VKTFLRFVLAAGAVVALTVIAVFVYFTYFAGPTVYVTRNGPNAHVEALFLEYALGLTRLTIVDTATRVVVLHATADENRPFASIFDLAPGKNDAHTIFGPEALVHTPAGGVFLLATGHRYAVTLWGNNGSARIRSTSFTLTM